MGQTVVPNAITRQVVARGGQTGEEGIAGVTVPRDGLIVLVVADVQGLLRIARDGGGKPSAELVARETGLNRSVLKVNSSNTTVVVVHGDVEQSSTHLH